MSTQQIISATQPSDTLRHIIGNIEYDHLFILTDEHTALHCLPLLTQDTLFAEAHHITIPPGDNHKHLNTLTHVWEQLCIQGATRHSLLINVGGGMVTDLGGFAAATYKRGIRCIKSSRYRSYPSHRTSFHRHKRTLQRNLSRHNRYTHGCRYEPRKYGYEHFRSDDEAQRPQGSALYAR